MRIILVANKTFPRSSIKRIDSTYWNFYIPLLELGHQVYFYDTVSPKEKNFDKIVKENSPDLIFSILCGDRNIAPHEPIEEIKKITLEGKIKTFNFFCDDTWRFNNFSKNICTFFTAVSTPEELFVEEYRKIGYDNCFHCSWHCNEDLFFPDLKKTISIVFCGGMNRQRHEYLSFLEKNNISVKNIHGSSYEDMCYNFSSSRILLNFSKNESDPHRKTQMKLRMFEGPAARTLLVTEYHEGIEKYFDIDKEIICFRDKPELLQKLQYLIVNQNLVDKLANNSYDRFLKEHTSKIRLQNLLQQIEHI